MHDWNTRESERTLNRLLPRIIPHLGTDKEVFIQCLRVHFPTLFKLLHGLYGNRYDFHFHLEQTLTLAAQLYAVRPADLKQLDQAREKNPLWFKSERMMGGVLYVDLFAGDLKKVQKRIPYFKELGITYLHLMPLFKAPEEDSDGGYAVSDYRTVDPRLGTMKELAKLAQAFRANGISLVLDFVFNHTSDEHLWAQNALKGDVDFQEYYFLFDDRQLPDAYERSLREIFPEQSPGNFTYQPQIQKWAWTTFRKFQWDLNYSNPAVFNAMMEEMLFLANQGIEILRLDAVAFIWKRLGTSCESLPEAHQIIQAYNALVRIVAPALLFKSEAIVHPDDVASYINQAESPISYNPTLMALLWEAIATRDVRLLQRSMQKRFRLQADCAWVNYIRCHDDIGWTFADEDAAELGINGFDHRQFLNTFYTGRFPGSFAKGVPFNYNPATKDMRISGSAASLAGLEQALEINNPLYIEHAQRRLLLLHSVIISAGGIPLLYLGDEIATLNDYTYEQDPAKRLDSRWAHRARFDWDKAEQRHDTSTVQGRIFMGIKRLAEIRQQNSSFGSADTVFVDTGNKHVFGYVIGQRILILANFSEYAQVIDRANLPTAITHQWTNGVVELVGQNLWTFQDSIRLEPYDYVWLSAAPG